jgi:Protein of unknown function (DUF998)
MSTTYRSPASSAERGVTGTRLLLACGVVYGVSYVIANDVIAAAWHGEYGRLDQAVSELSAKGAESRPFLAAMVAVWALAMIAFGVGVWRSARGNRHLRITGVLLAAFGVSSLLWLPFPMTARADIVEGAVVAGDDLGHIVMAGVTVALILAQIGFGAVALGTRFRLYSLASAIIVLLFGAVTGTQSPNIANGEPTPWMGLYERVSIGAWLLWMAVLAVVLWRDASRDRAISSTGVRARPRVRR